MCRFFLEMPVQMSKAVTGDQFLIGDSIRIGVIAQTLKGRAASRIVQVADKDIELNELEYGFHTTILLIWLSYLRFQPLIHISNQFSY